jgi:hypothetical protein
MAGVPMRTPLVTIGFFPDRSGWHFVDSHVRIPRTASAFLAP